ncbi:MAG: PorT family protein [Bacteroidetes bacterium]|nr:PorT family protein [Bacteroidota bacterium]HET6245555.1 porin family protein [Bacteroidia bacterium]
MKRASILNIKSNKKNMQVFSSAELKIKSITAIIVLLLLANITYAQDFKKFRFGLKAAPNISWLKPGSPNFEAKKDANKPALKFSYGLMTEFALSENYSFVTGLEVTTLGGSLNFPDSAYYISGTPPDNVFILTRRTYHFQYIELPLTLKMKTNEIGYMRYFGQFGFNIGFRSKVRADDRGKFTDQNFKDAPNEVEIPESLDISKDTQLFRVALNLGAGIEYNLVGNTALVISVNYNNGFTNALKKNSGVIMDKTIPTNNVNHLPLNQKATTNYVALNVGILF